MLLSWFPLDGTLTNQGLNNDTIYVGASYFEDVGYIQNKSLRCSGSTQAFMNNPFVGLDEWSFSFWYRPNTPGTWSDIFTFSGSYERIEFSAANGANLTWYSNNTTYSSICTSGTTIATGLSNNTWVHILVTFNSGSTNIYVNGTLKVTQTGKVKISSDGSNKIYFGSRINSSYANINIQDIRCYNHCLSDFERNTLFKYLITHQTFDDCYRRVEFVESFGQGYIDTGVKATNNTCIEVDALTTTGTSTYGTTTGLNVTASSSYPGGYFYYWNRGSTGSQGTSTTVKRTVYKQDNNKCYRDGQLVATYTATTFTDTQNIWLFGRNSNGSLNDAGSTKIFSCKIWEKGVLIRDYVPVIDLASKGECGLYDLVNEKFYGNQYLYAYLPLDYLSSTGGQYINTGVAASSNIKMQVKFRPDEVTGGVIFGTAAGNDSADWRLFNYNSNIYFDMGNARINGSTCSSGTVYDFEFGNYYVKDLSTNTTLISGSAQSYSSSSTIGIFGDSYGARCKATLFSARIYNGQECVRDYIPVMKFPSFLPGLLDKVNYAFYDSLTGTEFTKYGAPEGCYEANDYIQEDTSKNRHTWRYGYSSLNDNQVNGLVGKAAAEVWEGPTYPSISAVSNNYSEFTVCAYIHVQDISGVVDNYTMDLISNEYNTLSYHVNYDDDIDNLMLDGNIIAGSLSDDWWFLAMVYNGSTLTVYLDDSVVYSGSQTHVPTFVYFVDYEESDGGQYLYKLDDVRVYAKALTASQISDVMYRHGVVDNKGNVAVSALYDQYNDLGIKGQAWVSDQGLGYVSIISQGSQTFQILDAYVPLEYIEATNGKYIDTGFKPNQDTKVEMTTTFSNPNAYYFGAWNSAYNNGAYAVGNDGGSIYTGYDGQGGGANCSPLGYLDSRAHVIVQDKNNTYIDGKMFRCLNYSTFQVNYNLYLFGQNRAGTYYSPGTNLIRCQRCKIWDNNKLVRDYIAVKRKSDGAIGMFDTITETFKGNAGSGTFGEGPSLQKLYRNSAYTYLDYIEATGTQQIDTGLKFNMNSDQCEVVFQATQQAQNGMIFANSNTTNHFWFYHYNDSGRIDLYIQNAGSQQGISGPAVDTNKHKFEWKNKTYYLDGVSKGTDSRTLNTTETNIYLFSWGNSYYYIGRMYSCIMKDSSGTVVRNFKPVIRNSDKAIGMLDTVNNVFYANSGSGSFIAGPVASNCQIVSCNNFYINDASNVINYDLHDYNALV